MFIRLALVTYAALALSSSLFGNDALPVAEPVAPVASAAPAQVIPVPAPVTPPVVHETMPNTAPVQEHPDLGHHEMEHHEEGHGDHHEVEHHEMPMPTIPMPEAAPAPAVAHQ